VKEKGAYTCRKSIKVTGRQEKRGYGKFCGEMKENNRKRSSMWKSHHRNMRKREW